MIAIFMPGTGETSMKSTLSLDIVLSALYTQLQIASLLVVEII